MSRVHSFVVFTKSWEHLDTGWKPSTKSFLKSLFNVILQARFTKLGIYWIWMEDKVKTQTDIIEFKCIVKIASLQGC